MKASKFGLAPAARLRRVSDKISRCSDGETHLALQHRSTEIRTAYGCTKAARLATADGFNLKLQTLTRKVASGRLPRFGTLGRSPLDP